MMSTFCEHRNKFKFSNIKGAAERRHWVLSLIGSPVQVTVNNNNISNPTTEMPKDMTKSFYFASFSHVTDNHIKRFSTAFDLPHWRTVGPGLNLEGTCKNKDCSAFEKKVWSPRGYGQFHLSYQIRNTPCVSCGKNLKKVECAGIWKG